MLEKYELPVSCTVIKHCLQLLNCAANGSKKLHILLQGYSNVNNDAPVLFWSFLYLYLVPHFCKSVYKNIRMYYFSDQTEITFS